MRHRLPRLPTPNIKTQQVTGPSVEFVVVTLLRLKRDDIGICAARFSSLVCISNTVRPLSWYRLGGMQRYRDVSSVDSKQETESSALAGQMSSQYGLGQ